MRLNAQQRRHILQAVRQHVGADGRVRVFGSRLRDNLRGGDIDLLIEADHHLPPLQKAALQLALESTLGYPVDILYHQTGQPLTPFQSIALANSRVLKEHVA